MRSARGTSMIEVLVSIMITVIGLLGLAGMQAQAQLAEFESYQRAQALLLLSDMVDRLGSNRSVASCFAITDASAGTPYFGDNTQAGHVGTPTCTAGTSTVSAAAVAAMTAWDGLLQGSSETLGTASVGAMVGARGCVFYDSTTELTSPSSGAAVTGSGIYTVAVVWQGRIDTVAPTRINPATGTAVALNCANTLYGTGETKRRAVYTTLRLAKLASS
ncbi:MAG: type IV pilus modification protein PilV [Betaproteobacteria bacterium]|nr:type IV pilus modification protein PilV [Betaproteobacteria bacterium]